MQRVYEDDGFEFERLNLLGATYGGLSDVGEVLATIERIPNADHESWVREFAARAALIRGQADESRDAGHTISARSAYLRASTYYATASANAPGTADPDRYHSLWERHRDCWDAAVTYFDPAVEKISIPFEDTALEGYFFRAANDPSPRPTVILNNGSDGAVSDMWLFGGKAAVERGRNAMTFDGPGQGAAFHRLKLYFRADWETVITPVVDWLLTRPDVDANRLVLSGVSQAGYWVPRALAFEHRIKAGVADPGCMRVADSWLAHLPDFLRDMLNEGNKKDFDDMMNAGMEQDPALKATLEWRMAPYGTDSVFEAYTAAMKMSLDEATLQQITCPVLITNPDGEQFWPGHSEEMHRKLPSSTLVNFTEAEGANWHCEPAAHALRDERVFDWLATVVP